MFCDLNVKKPALINWEPVLEETVERLIKYGYKQIAITTDIDESVLEKSKKEKENKKKVSANEISSVIPLPPNLVNLKSKFNSTVFYQRINIIVAETCNIRKFLQCKNIKKYDIISFQPEQQNVLKFLTGIGEVDIISYNPESKSDLSFSRKLYNQFVNQNIFFELMYTPAILDLTARRNSLSLAHTYHAVGKSRNIIVTSGAQSSTHVRGPHDVINFNLLFGLSEEQSKSSITRNCKKLLLKARKQRRQKSLIEMVRTQETNKDSVKMDS